LFHKPRGYNDAVQKPPQAPDLVGAMDLTCRCDRGHQDRLAVPKRATRNDITAFFTIVVLMRAFGLDEKHCIA
jgi:hypothetical protein